MAQDLVKSGVELPAPDDRGPVEIFQDAGPLHRAPGADRGAVARYYQTTGGVEGVNVTGSLPTTWVRVHHGGANPGWYSKAFSDQLQYREALPVVSEGDLETLLPPELAGLCGCLRNVTLHTCPTTDVGVVSRGGLLGVRCKSRDSFNDEGIDDLLPKG